MGIFRLDFRKEFSNLNSPFTAAAIQMMLAMNDKSFRENIEKLIRETGNIDYNIDSSVPALYKYCRLSKYVIDDIKNHVISFSPVESLNDYYDSAIITLAETADAKYQEILEQLSKMEKEMSVDPQFSPEWQDINDWVEQICGDLEPLCAQNLRKQLHLFHENQARGNFKYLASNLGVIVRSLSENPISTLMWAHYADVNQGICVEYDYSNVPFTNCAKSMLFPVAYIDHPLDVTAYFDDKNRICEHCAEVAVYASAICKADCWNYEREWRMVMLLNPYGVPQEHNYIQFSEGVSPKSITLGYHILKPFCDEQRFCEHRKYLLELVCIIQDRGIPLYITAPDNTRFCQMRKKIPVQVLEDIIQNECREVYDIHFYPVLQDKLLSYTVHSEETKNG